MKTVGRFLADVPFLAVDCQSTGATPAHGSLVEIGWARTSSPAVVAHVVALPDEEELSPTIARITGLTVGDMSNAISPADAWHALVAECQPTPVPTIIHFARFEERFLRALHESTAPDATFPLDIVCTHAIATRLLPRLPRRGLRALAGYFGMTVEPARRCADHVAATVFVWRHLLELLDKVGVRTTDDLSGWMRRAPRARPTRTQKRYPMPRARRLYLPDAPGVYRMLRSNGDVLYVGKATSLRKRVNSYFQKQTRVADRTLEMLSQARDLSVVETATATEAALLESDEIKRCEPPYNRALVDRPSRHAVRGALRDIETVEHMRALEELLPVEPGWALATGARLWRMNANLSPHPTPAPGGGKEIGRGRGREGAGATESEIEVLIADILVRGARAVRRARWMCRLAESTVAWRIGNRSRMLVIEGGAIVHRDDRAIPIVPPGWRRPMKRRWDCFDLATYDRVRVLATELRRLVDHADYVAVRLGPSTLLDRERLARTLTWV